MGGVLFITGYLTQRDKAADGPFQLVIPNQKIRQIFAEQMKMVHLLKQRLQHEMANDPPIRDRLPHFMYPS